MNGLHIHAPAASERRMKRLICPTDGRRTYMACFFTEWYGWEMTCLRCGDSWADGEMSPRPFERGWRKRSIEAVKKRWRSIAGAVSVGETTPTKERS